MLREILEARGWCTGRVLQSDFVEQIIPLLHIANRPVVAGPDDWFIVVSQTCDVVANLLEQEPFVEVLHGRVVANSNGSFKRLRSTRRLHFQPDSAQYPNVWLECHATADRYPIPRDLLLTQQPCNVRRVDSMNCRQILAWFALRAARPSWPNELVDRIDRGKVRKQLEAALTKVQTDDVEVRVHFSPDEELPPDQSYQVAIFFILDDELYNHDPEARDAATQAYQEFSAILGEIEGIEIRDESCLVSGSGFTWQDMRTTDEWNFANLSSAD